MQQEQHTCLNCGHKKPFPQPESYNFFTCIWQTGAMLLLKIDCEDWKSQGYEASERNAILYEVKADA